MRARRLKRMIALTVILMVPALPASGGVVARASEPAGTSSVWQIEFVDGYSFGYQSSSLALDALDSPFIAYLRDGVRVALAHKIGQTWHRGFVDNGDSGAAVALSSGGLPRISYDRDTNLRVSIGTKAGWLTGRLDDANNGSSTSIAVAPGGGIGVTYEGSDFLLRFALITRQKTTIETVDSPSAGWSSLVFDETGLPHIAYLDQSNTTVRYAYRTSQGSWITTSIEGCSFAGAGHSLALDSEGKAHMVCLAGGVMTYVSEMPDGSFQSEPIDGLGYASGMSLALDAQDQPHVAVTDDRQIEYATKTGSGWQVEVVDPPVGGLSRQQPWIVLDSQGLAHMTYTQCKFVDELCVSWRVKFASQAPAHSSLARAASST